MTKPELQEKALQLEVSIYYPEGHAKEGKELNLADLKTAVDAQVDALQVENAQRQADKENARTAEPEPDLEPVVEPDPEAVVEPDPEAVDAAPKTRRRRAAVAEPDAKLLKALGLPRPGDRDRALARKHGYPVAIPGGRAYRTSASFNCSMGGGLRPLGSVVILTEVQADHKAAYITPV